MRQTMTIFSTGLLLGAMAGAASAQLRRDGNLQVGDAAPDFTVQDVEGKQTVQLGKLKGKPVVLLFGSCT